MDMKRQINVLILINPGGKNAVTFLIGWQMGPSAGLEVSEDAKNSLPLQVTYVYDLRVNSAQTISQNSQIFVED